MLAQINIAPVKSAILIIYDWFNYLIINYLLSDAEVWKDILQDILWWDFAGDGAEVMQGEAYILAHEVGRDIIL